MSSPSRLIILDFEATCAEHETPRPQEIIEFPSVLVAAEGGAVVDEFVSFVRPVHHPRLTPFCTELTSITQKDVEGASPFDEVFRAHQEWLTSHDARGEDCVLVTCGDWDLKTMLPAQLRASGVDFVPPMYRRWVNVKAPFRAWHGKHARAPMTRMLELLGLTLEGRHHRGIDDCRNIAKIVRSLLAKGIPMEPIQELPRSRYPPISIVLQRRGERRDVRLEKRALASLLGLAEMAYRKQVTEAYVDGAPLSDASLPDLRSGAVIEIP